MSEYCRPVAAIDRILLALTAERPPLANQMVVMGRGSLDSDELQHALDITTEANPGSALVLRGMDGSASWHAEQPPPLRHVSAPGWSGDDDHGAEFFADRLNAVRGPSCEVVTVDAGDKVAIVFRSLHAVMDGRGTVMWAEEFMRALRGEPLLGHRSTLNTDELMRGITDETRAMPEPDAVHPLGRITDVELTGAFHWRRLTLDRPLDPGMLCRIAIALKDLAVKNGPGEVRFTIPVDARRHCPGERTTGNLLGSLHVPVTDQSAQGLGLQIVQQLYRNKDALQPAWHRELSGIATSRLRMHIRSSLAHIRLQGLHLSTAILSNLGRLSSAALSGGAFEATSAFFVPPLADWACFVGINGFDEQVEVTVALPTGYCLDDGLERIASEVRAALTD